MTLDKHQILSELGSVMNQLQSAECGCMGKIFSNCPKQSGLGGHGSMPMMGCPLPTCGACRRGCCHGHGDMNNPGNMDQSFNMGQPSNMGQSCNMGQTCHGNQPCFGSCNPRKLYADTYNYLNQNLMQPTVKEVYEDLKDISPANTIMNNTVANPLGISGGGTVMQGGAAISPNQMANGLSNPVKSGSMPNQMQGMNGMQNNQMANLQVAQMMGGMGPQIMGMMSSPDKPGHPNSNNALPSPVTQDLSATQRIPQRKPPGMNMQMGSPNSGNQNMTNPAIQYMTQQNNNTCNSYVPAARHDGIQGHSSGPNQIINANPIPLQMPGANRNYGQHSAGMTKFNEMFPGVMGNDLGFDPMSIALQMNPANQKSVAMSTMQKMMMGDNKSHDSNNPHMQRAMAGVNAVTNALTPQTPNQTNAQPPMPQQMQTFVTQCQQGIPPQIPQQPIQDNQQQESMNKVSEQMHGNQTEQVYTVVTGSPTMNQQQSPQMEQELHQNQQNQAYRQQLVSPQVQHDSLTGGTVPASLPPIYEDSPDIKQMQQPQNEIIKEPIYPANTNNALLKMPPGFNPSYNTLGQPIEKIPAQMFHVTIDPNAPAPLYTGSKPAINIRSDYERLGIKATESKTALMGNKPVGRSPSRSQLQHIYSQYKGSKSYTQQNIKQPIQNGTLSERQLRVEENQQQNVPVERVAGDNLNNRTVTQVPVKAHPTEQIGDPQIGATGDVLLRKQVPPMHRLRNGLQDVVYTAYPASHWSLYGREGMPSVPCQRRSRR